ncbi:MAG: hypothetical protein JNK64_16335 [Myxococcales bacterium]|nr:hypothetical protein [Myxococcales bacterium]
MSNRAYLTVTPWARIYPSFGDLAYQADAHTALASAGCVPLTWLALFSSADLTSQTFPRKPPVTVEAPLAPTADAVARLRARRAWLQALFTDRGPIGYHIDLLLAHLATYDGAWISIELEEIAALHRDAAAWHQQLRAALTALDREDADAARPLLAEISTVMLDRRFVTLADAPAATREEQWNFFRLLGEGWARAAAWD